MRTNSAPIDPAVHETAVRLAIACRRIVQVCLREEEWIEADREFYQVIRDGLLKFACRPDAGGQPAKEPQP